MTAFSRGPPQAVYAAFSALGPEGVTTVTSADGIDRKVSTRISKTRGEAIRYEILLDDRPVVTADLAFAPADEGRATRMTAELDIDAFELGSAYQTEAGVALSLVPDSFIDARFAEFMEDMARDIEAGRPLPPLRADRAGRRSGATIPTRAWPARLQRRPARPARGGAADDAAAADGRSRSRRPRSCARKQLARMTFAGPRNLLYLRALSSSRESPLMRRAAFTATGLFALFASAAVAQGSGGSTATTATPAQPKGPDR